MTDFFDTLKVNAKIEGPSFAPTRETIRQFCEASLDFNPLHLDDNYMQGNFGRSNFGGIIMHGMNNFGLITRMLTDWSYEHGGIHRRLETRWLMPVKPGDTIRPHGEVVSKLNTTRSRWITVKVEVKNQRNETVAVGEAHLEFPVAAAA